MLLARPSQGPPPPAFCNTKLLLTTPAGTASAACFLLLLAVLRLPAASTMQLIEREQPRSPRFPGNGPEGPKVQWLKYANVTYAGQRFENMLWLVDYRWAGSLCKE